MDLDTEKIISRLKELYGVSKDGELAVALGVAKSNVPNWRARGSVPLEHAMRAAEEHNVTLDFIYRGITNGVGEMRNGYKVSSGLTVRVANLSDTQRVAVQGMLDALEKMVGEFEKENLRALEMRTFMAKLREIDGK